MIFFLIRIIIYIFYGSDSYIFFVKVSNNVIIWMIYVLIEIDVFKNDYLVCIF